MTQTLLLPFLLARSIQAMKPGENPTARAADAQSGGGVTPPTDSLALNGERDLQVPAKPDLEAIEKALKAGGNKDVKVRISDGAVTRIDPDTPDTAGGETAAEG